MTITTYFTQNKNKKLRKIRTPKSSLNFLWVVFRFGEVCLSIDGGEQGEGRQGGAPRHAQGQAQGKCRLLIFYHYSDTL